MSLSRGLGVLRCFPTSGFRCHYETLFYATVSLSPHVIATPSTHVITISSFMSLRGTLS